MQVQFGNRAALGNLTIIRNQPSGTRTYEEPQYFALVADRTMGGQNTSFGIPVQPFTKNDDGSYSGYMTGTNGYPSPRAFDVIA